MSKIEINKDRYTVEPLYQWDLNQVLNIYGVNVMDPEIHFTNDATVRSIGVRPIVNAEGVITVDIPNSFLQKAGQLIVYVCGYEDATFKTYFKIVVPVKVRPRPADYTLDANDGEYYSFNALTKRVNELERAVNIGDSQTYYGYTYNAHSDNLDEKPGKYSLKQYFPIISESLIAIRTALNVLKAKTTERFSTVEKKHSDDVKQLGVDIENAKLYREPWNVDENVGYINAVSGSFDVYVESEQTASASYLIPMKNSGSLYLDLNYDILSTYTPKSHGVKVYCNKTLLATYTDEGQHSLLLTVSKGDIVTVTVEGEGKTTTNVSSRFELAVNNIMLRANINTPYVYLSLDGADVIDADALDVLLGGAE